MDDAVSSEHGRPTLAVLVLAVVLPPAVAGLALGRLGVPGLNWTPYLDLTLVRPLVLAAAASVYVHWRITAEDVSRLTTVALTATGLPGLLVAGLVVAQPPATAGTDLRRLLAHVLVVVIGLGVAQLDLPARRPVGPMVVGLSTGLGLSAMSLFLLYGLPVHPVSDSTAAAMAVVPVLAAAAFTGLLVVRHPALGRAQLGLATGLLLVVIGRAGVMTASDNRGPALAVACGAAILLAGSALTLVSGAIRETADEVTLLYERLYDVERRDRDQRALLHEIGSTVAGLVSASRLVAQPGDLPHGGRSAMESLVRSQVERLERIFSADEPAVRPVALDEVLQPLVLAQAAQGHPIDWEPSGVQVEARPDDVAEIVRVLLDNAGRHAESTTTRIDVRRVGGTVEVAVSDDGRGLPDEVRARLFAWGVRGLASQGQGIGLSHARRLALRLGGYLVLDERTVRGTTFVLGLRAHAETREIRETRLESAGVDEGGPTHELA